MHNSNMSAYAFTFKGIYETIADELSCGWEVLEMRNSHKQLWSEKNIRFIVTLRYQDREIIFNNFSLILLDCHEHFRCLVQDSISTHGKNFYTFCMTSGMTNGSITAYNTYKRSKKNAQKLKTLVGQELYERLIECNMDL